MNLLLILIVIAVVTAIIAIISAGLSEQLKKANEKKDKINVLWTGFIKVLTPLFSALLSVLCIAILLSFIVHPTYGNVMPAYTYDEAKRNLVYSDQLDVDATILKIEEKMKEDPEEAYFAYAYLYWLTDNGDLAINALKQCMSYNRTWEYAYDLGVVYSSETDFANALKYFNQAKQLDPPLEERGLIMSSIQKIRDYHFMWLKSLFGLNK